jgi:hypothetical protein
MMLLRRLRRCAHSSRASSSATSTAALHRLHVHTCACQQRGVGHKAVQVEERSCCATHLLLHLCLITLHEWLQGQACVIACAAASPRKPAAGVCSAAHRMCGVLLVQPKTWMGGIIKLCAGLLCDQQANEFVVSRDSDHTPPAVVDVRPEHTAGRSDLITYDLENMLIAAARCIANSGTDTSLCRPVTQILRRPATLAFSRRQLGPNQAAAWKGRPHPASSR